MAIAGNVENEFGAQFTYHKIKDVRITSDDKNGITLSITVQSWINKQARIDGKQPSVRQCIILSADFAMTPFYELLKAKFTDFDQDDDFDNSFKSIPEKTQSAKPRFIEQTPYGRLISKREE
ncbi:MAG: hypothetical protein J6S67_03235 [Methanobrevibacter sp.]|nr:hypothetical protein [Methanobrevibacter sp.]